jgi:hypothetical protein
MKQESQTQNLSHEDFCSGHKPCQCGKFTYVFGLSAMEKLSPNYYGEHCQQCGLFMYRIDKMNNGADK